MTLEELGRLVRIQVDNTTKLQKLFWDISTEKIRIMKHYKPLTNEAYVERKGNFVTMVIPFGRERNGTKNQNKR